MAKLDSWASEHELPPEPFTRMKQAVIALFAEMERRGELDSSSSASVTWSGLSRPARYPGGGRLCNRRCIDIPVYLGKLWAVWQ